MKLMFEFPAMIGEYRQLVGNTIHFDNPELFALSHRTFGVNPNVWFDLGFVYDRGLIRGRAFIDSQTDTIPMNQICIYLQTALHRTIPSLDYHPAPTWEGSLSHIQYVRRTGNTNLSDLSGTITTGA